jgi:hypothetical protein
MSDKLDVVEFGRQLVTTGDLDPVYVALYGANLEPDRLRKWLLAYWCFYSCGTASWIVDQQSFWDAMRTAAASSDYPRGTERRHFRGSLAVTSVDALYEAADYAAIGSDLEIIEAMFYWLCYPMDAERATQPIPLAKLMERVMRWRGFGEWIAFKVADMLERLGLAAIDFSDSDAFLFDSPREGAALVVERYGPKGFPLVTTPEAWALAYLGRNLGSLPAPPRAERLLNGQEYETILCKWKAHLSGHYAVGHDIAEIRESLLRFAHFRTSQRLLAAIRRAL